MRKQVLFSCAGTTDPIRGEHDGPMLHILRHYRPDTVYLFLSREIREYEDKDKRFEKTCSWISRRWDGYQPCFRYINSEIKDVFNMDVLDQPLHDTLDLISRENPEAEILINLTSGTPQMQIILSQFAMDTRYRARGIQVRNHERKAGTTQRTNDKTYDIELELECNEDELPGTDNRCFEPKMYAIRREFLRRQIVTLLNQRDFEAIEAMKDSLPENLRNLVLHLNARSRLQSSEAERLSAKVRDLPFKLYAYRMGERDEYKRVSEYYLLMKNLMTVGNYTEFLLHMEPLTLTLMLAMLDKLTGNQMNTFIYSYYGRRYFDPSRLRDALPDLYQHYEQSIKDRGWEVRVNEVSTYLCSDLMSFYSAVPDKTRKLFADYDNLKDVRNKLAHELYSVTADEISTACGKTPKKLLEEIEATMAACYPACDPVIFSVYDRSIDYIKNNL